MAGNQAKYSPQQAVKRSADIVAYTAGRVDAAAKPALGRTISTGGATMKQRYGVHLWRLGLVTLMPRTAESWFTAEVVARPTALGHKVYGALKARGDYDLRIGR